MPRRKITATFVDKVQAPSDKPQEDYFDTVLPAFGLRVGKRKKTWFVMVRALRNGEWKMQRTTLGTTAEMDLTKARESAREAMQRAEQGKAPIEVKRERRAALEAESRNSFSVVREEFLKKYVGRKQRRPAPRTLTEMRRVLESDLFADWDNRALAAITRRDVMDALDDLIERGAAVMANRTLAYLRLLFKWAIDRGIVNADPSAGVKKPGAENSRDRTLTPEELRAVWHATAPTQVNHGDLFASIIKVLILTGQRAGEVAGMRWSEVDLESRLWTLESGRAKNHREHLVPLSDPVLAILEERRAEQTARRMTTDLVFTSAGTAPFSGWSKSKARLDCRAQVAPWTIHDLRRSFVTRAGEDLRIAPNIIEAIINHVSGTRAGVAGVYNRALYLDERRAALNAWADYVLQVVGEVSANNVVELARHG
jgi:integrase